MWKDLRYTLRMLGQNPGFAAVAVVTLALGIGANSAVFSVFDEVILQLLPVENPRELVLIELTGPDPAGMTISDSNSTVHSYPQYVDLRDRSDVFSAVAARTFAPVVIAHEGEGDRADGELVSGNFFEVLGVKPVRGRLFTMEDDRTEGGHRVAVLSYAFWQERFGGREDIIGRKALVNGQPTEVIGVVSPEFGGLLSGSSPGIYLTLAMRKAIRPGIDGSDRLPERMVRTMNVVARLRPGVTQESAEAAMQGVWRGIQDDELAELGPRIRDREEFLTRKVKLTQALQGIHTLREQIEQPLFSVTALVALVMLIACVNVASLLMARAVARGREIALRMAIGATRGALVRQVLVESLVLGVCGGIAGLAVAAGTMKLLETLIDGAELNGRVLAFNFGLALITALLFGLAPALRATQMDVTSALKDQSAGLGHGHRHALFRQGAVAVQVTLSLLLLVAAGLFVRTLYNLQTFDPGFRTERLLSFAIDPELNGYSAERGRRLSVVLAERLRQLPGVREVGGAQIPVLGNAEMASGVRIEGYEAAEGEDPGTSRNAAIPGYFRTLGIPVVRGREFNEGDRSGGRKVAVVNEEFARNYYGEENPLGRKIAFGRNEDPFDIEIVGVVKNQKSANLREETKKFVYLPYSQATGLPPLTFYLLTDRDEASLGPDVRRAVRDLDANLPVFRMETVASRRAETIRLELTVARLASGFAGIATLLAAIGLYGLMAYGVARRTREIGVRVALGARRHHVVQMVLKEAVIYLLLGLAVGLPLALGMGRLLESQLFGLKAGDPLVVAAAAAALSAAGLTAAFVPARRAARVNPVIALRHE